VVLEAEARCFSNSQNIAGTGTAGQGNTGGAGTAPGLWS